MIYESEPNRYVFLKNERDRLKAAGFIDYDGFWVMPKEPADYYDGHEDINGKGQGTSD